MYGLYDTPMKKIEFISLIKGVETTMPIIPAKEYKHQWMIDMAKDFKKTGSLAKGGDHAENERVLHTSRCPGIINIKNEGWLVRTHQDIKLNISGAGLKWSTPLNDYEASFETGEVTVGIHKEFAYTDFRKNWPEGWFKGLVKINTPWVVKVPLGYKLLQLHPSHLDTGDWMAVPGSYTDSYGMPKLNAVLAFFRDGEYMIPAGTPVAQMILVKNDDVEMEQRGRDDKFMADYEVHSLIAHNKFQRSYNYMKETWHKWMKK